jgi:hypothetical protein
MEMVQIFYVTYNSTLQQVAGILCSLNSISGQSNS